MGIYSVAARHYTISMAFGLIHNQVTRLMNGCEVLTTVTTTVFSAHGLGVPSFWTSGNCFGRVHFFMTHVSYRLGRGRGVCVILPPLRSVMAVLSAELGTLLSCHKLGLCMR